MTDRETDRETERRTERVWAGEGVNKPEADPCRKNRGGVREVAGSTQRQ